MSQQRIRTMGLIFFHSHTCGACQAALPFLAEFERLHRLEISILKVQGDDLMERLTGWIPRATPAYVLKVDGQVAGKATGAMDLEELEFWVGKVLASKREEPLRQAEAS